MEATDDILLKYENSLLLGKQQVFFIVEFMFTIDSVKYSYNEYSGNQHSVLNSDICLRKRILWFRGERDGGVYSSPGKMKFFNIDNIKSQIFQKGREKGGPLERTLEYNPDNSVILNGILAVIGRKKFT